MFHQLFRHFVKESRLYRKVQHRRQFPGLSVSESACLEIEGEFFYGTASSIGERARVIVRNGSALKIGHGVQIGRECEIVPRSQVDIGDSTSIQDRSFIHGDVSIGRYCSLSLNVFVSAGTHCFDLYPEMFIKDQDLIWINRPELVGRYSKPVKIEDDCWLGINSVILSGSRIGKGAIVGANSVVTNDIPPYSIAVGAPARVIKQRLKFIPPSSITFLSIQDLPYFYSGFALSAEELDQGRRDGGVYAERRFQIALDTKGAKTIVLEARGLCPTACSVYYENQKVEVSQKMQVIRFMVGSESLKFLEFEVSAESSVRWVICVASVRAE